MSEQEPGAERPFERVPEELKQYTQWVNWRIEQDWKIPVNSSTLGNAGVHWENTWAPFEHATATAVRYHLGLGFVLTEEDPFTCVDLDNSITKEGEVSDQTRAILSHLSSWVELSPSGSGLHVWVRNELPINRKRAGIEIYSSARWISVTGRSNPQAPLAIPDRTTELQELVSQYFQEDEREFTKPPRTLEDDELWHRLFTSPHGAFFESLYRGDTSVCYNDHSRAVIMLANQLALLSDFDAARVKRLLYQTGLVTQKWEERRGNHTWIDYQIQDAIRYVSGKKR